MLRCSGFAKRGKNQRIHTSYLSNLYWYFPWFHELGFPWYGFENPIEPVEPVEIVAATTLNLTPVNANLCHKE